VIKNIWMNDLDASDLSASDFRDDQDTEDPDLWKNNEMFSYFAYILKVYAPHAVTLRTLWGAERRAPSLLRSSY